MTLRANRMTSGARPTQEAPSVPARKLPMLLACLREGGIDGRKLMKRCDIEPERANAPEGRIALASWVELVRSAACALQDPDLGLHLGERFSGMPTVLGYLMSACATAREALHSFLRYQRLEHDGCGLIEHRVGPAVELEYCAYVSLAEDRLLTDFSLASVLGLYRLLTGEALAIEAAEFAYPRPGGSSEHQRIFQGSVQFSAGRNRIRFRAQALEQPLLRGNPAVRQQLEGPLNQALHHLDTREPMSARVVHALGRTLNHGEFTIHRIASQLRLGTRSLQLNLQEEGTTFREVLESVRKALALDFLADPTISLLEVTFLLGFSEPSAFHRAFRRWTGATPAEFRKQANS